MVKPHAFSYWTYFPGYVGLGLLWVVLPGKWKIDAAIYWNVGWGLRSGEVDPWMMMFCCVFSYSGASNKLAVCLGSLKMLSQQYCMVDQNLTVVSDRYAKITTDRSLGITLLVQKYYFIPVKRCHLWHVSCLFNLLQVTTCYLKLVLCKAVLCVDTWLVNPTGYVSFYDWMIHRLVSSSL